jgi:hypothetical protein
LYAPRLKPSLYFFELPAKKQQDSWCVFVAESLEYTHWDMMTKMSCWRSVDDHVLVCEVPAALAKKYPLAEEHVDEDLLDELQEKLSRPRTRSRRLVSQPRAADSAMLDAALQHINAIDEFSKSFYVTAANPEGMVLTPYQLVLEAFNRQLSTRQNLADMLQDILKETPPLAWQEAMLTYRLNLPPKDQDLLDDYQGSGYADTNAALRLDPKGEATLNDIIMGAPPLPQDIIVYRFMLFDPDMTVDPGVGRMVLDGYLSTTFHASYAVKKASEHGYKRIFRIRVPAGSLCMLMIGGTDEAHYEAEHELLFAHPQVLDLKSFSPMRFLKPDSSVVDLPVYEADLVMADEREIERIRIANPVSRELVDPTAEATTPHFRAKYPAVKAWYNRWFPNSKGFVFDVNGEELHTENLPESLRQCDMDEDDNEIFEQLTLYKPVSAHPELIILMGAPGSGKSSSLAAVFPMISTAGQSAFVVVDPDDLRLTFSASYRTLLLGFEAYKDKRYRDLLKPITDGAQPYLMQSGYGTEERKGFPKMVAYMNIVRDTDCLKVGRRFTRVSEKHLDALLPRLLLLKHNVVLDTTCADFKSCQKTAEFAVKNGYQVTFVAVTAPLSKTLARARIRAFRTGRWIDGDDLREIRDNVEEQLPTMRAFVRKAGLRALVVDNSGAAPVVKQKIGFAD